MRYYEVMIADGRYHSSAPLTYSSEEPLEALSIVSVPLRNRLATGYISSEVSKPQFAIRPIKSLLSQTRLPFHCIQLAEWLSSYYLSTLGEALKLFAPATPVVRKPKVTQEGEIADMFPKLDLDNKLTKQQVKALDQIRIHPSTTVLLHGDTGSGKTRVYLELASEVLESGKSVVILVPEIALTAQLMRALSEKLSHKVVLLHSELSAAQRKKTWFKILESDRPQVIVGPRSALFAPVHNLGLVIVDEAHEPAYKQEQSPRYQAVRVASQLGMLNSARVVLGTATPSINDYYLAQKRQAVVRMEGQALPKQFLKHQEVVDIKQRSSFKHNPYISDLMIEAIKQALANKRQAMVFYNRRGSARIIICDRCGWQLLCPNCDIPLVFHADEHLARCHICGHNQPSPANCPECGNPDIIYRAIGSKALFEMLQRLFPGAAIRRFDSDNLAGERLDENYADILRGQTDILIGTQLLAKGLDLPRLEMVGVVSAETSLALPDFSAEERAFQLLHQVTGRVGRGHGPGKVIIQSHEPDSILIKASTAGDWLKFYEYALKERQQFRFPPFSYLLKLVCRRATLKGAQTASERLKHELLQMRLPVEITGPAPSFYARRGRYFYYQLVVKSKQRKYLLQMAAQAPAGWTVDLDPTDLL